LERDDDETRQRALARRRATSRILLDGDAKLEMSTQVLRVYTAWPGA
jgi:hypothetical protein